MCEPSQCSARWKTWCSSPINSTVCVGRLLCYYVAYCNVGCSKYPSHYRESDRYGAPSCVVWPVKTMWPLGNFVLQCWAETVYCRCDGNRDDSTISDQNWTKNREAAASRFTLRYQGLTGKWTSEWMNQSLFLCSLPLCHFLILSFQVVCFWEKILQHDFACCLSMLPLKFQGTWMVPSSYPFLPKQTSEKKKLRPNSNILHIFLKSFCISLPLNAKKSLLQHLFFAKHTYLLELHLELSSGSSLHLYRSLSLFYTRCAPFRVWKYSQALLPPYGITAHHFLPFRVPAKK